MRKSNVEFDYYVIEDVNRLYGLESSGKKDIIICKIYEDYTDNQNEWTGEYEIDYDGVTNIFCYINLIDNNLQIEFISGDSIHGSGSVYELDFDCEYHKEIINEIINRVLQDTKFFEFCKTKILNGSFIDNKNRCSYMIFSSKNNEYFDECEENFDMEI